MSRNSQDVYEMVYDEDGYTINCDICGSEIKWKDGLYVCPECGNIFHRADFFNYIGANLPGPKCIECDSIYPGCVVCPYDYIEE